MMRRIFTLLIATGLLLLGSVPEFAQQNVIYTVQGGDTLATIAAQFGVSQQTIIATNNLTNPNVLFAGQLLTIRVPAAPASAQPTPTQQFGTGGAVIIAPNNPAVSPTSTPIPVIVQPAPTQQFGTGGPVLTVLGSTYTVRTGEGLYEIAVRFGTTAEALAAVNGITNINAIQAGQVLRLPTGATNLAIETLGTGGPVMPTVAAYEVRAGDYLELLAARYGTTVAEIAQANEIENPSVIFPGQVLVIP
jgi:LysM repeat protein